MDIDDVERFYFQMEMADSALALWPWMIAGMILVIYEIAASLLEWMHGWDWRFAERYEDKCQ